MTCFRSEPVEVMGLSKSFDRPAGLDQPVPFQRQQVRPNGIICQPQRRGELVDRFAGIAQQEDYPPSSARKKTFVVMQALHSVVPGSIISGFPVHS